MQVVMGSGEGVYCLATFLQQFNVVAVVVVGKEKRGYVQGLGKHTVNMFVLLMSSLQNYQYLTMHVI